jgi:hypothetical protein
LEVAVVHHLSIAAREPEHVAGVLAELMGGIAVPDAENFFVWQLDDYGSGVEVYPAGTELQPGGATGGRFVKGETGRGFGPTHVALSVSTDGDTVENVARREGWQCFRCSRGPFHVIEVWVENETLIEILTPDYAREYLAFTRSQALSLRRRKSLPTEA